MMAEHPAPRLPNEPSRAYAAFLAYVVLPPAERSIDRAWRSTLTDKGQSGGDKRAPSHWEQWSSRFNWVLRSVAVDEFTAAQDVLTWQERRRVLREADWAQADALRAIVADGLTTAAQFVHSEVKHVGASDGHPAQTIIRESFDLSGLLRALVVASKLQSGVVFWPGVPGEPLSDVALDALINRELAALAAGRAADGVTLKIVYADDAEPRE